jgi:hypothetical protein
MKLKTTKQLVVEMTVDEVKALLTKLVGKKSGKTVASVTFDETGWKFNLTDETEEADLDEHKA